MEEETRKNWQRKREEEEEVYGGMERRCLTATVAIPREHCNFSFLIASCAAAVVLATAVLAPTAEATPVRGECAREESGKEEED